MDPVTHTLTGALIGQAGLKRRTGLAMPALIVGANLPDIDVACLLWLDGVEHLAFRRGITHGPVAWVLLPLLLAGALYWFDLWQARRGTRPEGRLPVRFGWLYGLGFLACLTHPALDWLNVYGVRLLEPFSSRWFYGDVLFIIDVWLWVLMGLGLWLSLRREKRGGNWRQPAWLGVILSVVFIGSNWMTTRSAEQLELIDGLYVETVASPPPLKFWERKLIFISPQGLHRTATWRSRGDVRDLRAVTMLPLGACDLGELKKRDDGLEAFLFWSRAPFAERAPDGSVLIRDARYYDPRARNRFTVALPDVECEPAPLP